MTSIEQTKLGLSPTLVIVMTIFIDITGFGMIIPLLPFYAETFNAGPTALGILVASFSMMQFVFSPILGKVSDNVGRKPVLLVSIMISALSFVFFALANSFLILLLSRIISGMATETAVAQAYIADTTSERERAKGIGRVGAAHGAGVIIGPAIGGFLSVYGFSAPGWAASALALLNLLFVFLFLPEPAHRTDPRMGPRSKPDDSYLSRLGTAPTRPLIGFVLIISFIITLAFSTIPVIMPLLGMSFFDFGSVEMSYVFIYIGFIQIVLQGFAIGRLAESFGEEKVIAFGSLLMMLGMLFMPLLPNVVAFLASLASIALGRGMTQTAIPSFISKKAMLDEQGGMLGVSQSVSSIARVPGPLVAGLVFEFAGLATPFFVSATLLIVAFGLGCMVLHACARSVDLKNA